MAGVGESWENLGQLGDQGAVFSLLDLRDGKVLAGTQGGDDKSLIYRSTDYGDNWTDLGRPVNESYLYCFAYLGWGIVVAGTGTPTGKIVRSIDYGQTWADLGQQAGENGIRTIVSRGDGIALAGTSAGRKILHSTDYGETWSTVCQLGGAGGVVHSLSNLKDEIIIAGAWPGCEIYRSIDNGDNWVLLSHPKLIVRYG